MNARYGFIFGGIILLAAAAGALVWAQLHQSANQGNQLVSTGIILTPTVTPSAVQEIKLIINSPSDGAVLNSAQLLVRGQTKANAEVFINEKDTTADASGNFSTTLTLDEGENLIIVTVNDADGNMAEKEFTVTYNAEG